MSVKVRPINKDDLRSIAGGNITKQVRTPTTKQLTASDSKLAGGVLSDVIFGSGYSDKDRNKDLNYEDEYTKTGYIQLPAKVMNPFIIGRDAPVYRAVLGLSKENIDDILHAKVLYDTVNQVELTRQEVKTQVFDPNSRSHIQRVEDENGKTVLKCPRYIYGADYLLYLVFNADLDGKIIKYLMEAFIKPVFRDVCRNYDNLNFKDLYTKNEELIKSFITTVENGGLTAKNIGYIFDEDQKRRYGAPRWLCGGYLFIIDEKKLGITEELKEAIEDTLDSYVFSNFINDSNLTQFDRFAVLDKLRKEDHCESLFKQALDYIFVLPIGYRRTIDNRVHRLSVQYNNLLKCIAKFNDVNNSPNSTFFAILSEYENIVRYIRQIFIGGDPVIEQRMTPNERSEYKSILDTLTSKEGLIRDRMEGAREDYSGRAVITYDPEMPIDTIGVPRKILEKIAEPLMMRSLKKDAHESEKFKEFKGKNLSKFSTYGSIAESHVTYEDYMEYWFKSDNEGTKRDRWAVIGRQPTLYYLGMQGFKVKPVDGYAIVLSPLIVMPFNADFDGDQMHINMPTSWESLKEVRENMAFENNIYYPKNGEITVVTRHEIVYGLWMCLTRSEVKEGTTYTKSQVIELAKHYGVEDSNNYSHTVYELVCNQGLNIYDTIDMNGNPMRAGVAAFNYAIALTNNTNYGKVFLYRTTVKKEKVKLSSYITESLLTYSGNRTDLYLSSINRLVKLGFAIAKIWPPNVSAIIPESVSSHVRKLIGDFNKDMEDHGKLVSYGFELESEFTVFFSTEYDKLKKTVTDYLVNNLDTENGYLTMMLSGGKGDKDNILQIFGMKGRVQKNDTTAFNCIISGCYADQLTGLEHFISAYGSRKGIADKVLATAEPGYLSRKLEHAGAPVVITNDDCQTIDGLKFYIDEIVPFLDESQMSKHGTKPDNVNDYYEFYKQNDVQTQLIAATEYLAPILVGRYVILPNTKEVFVKDLGLAKDCIAQCWGKYVKDDNTGEYKFIPPFTMWETKQCRYSRIFEHGVPVGEDVEYHSYDNALDVPYDPNDFYNVRTNKLYNPVIMRSPIRCKQPCCKKCYGIDLTKGKIRNIHPDKMLPKKGRGIGFIAAQAIGEPGTQMTMKNFQKGGVVTEANLTSSFELIEDYFELHNFANKKKNKRGIISYDALSPVAGYVKEQYLGNGAKRIIVTKTASPEDTTNLIPGTHKIIVYESTRLKSYVNRGDSFQLVQGNLDMGEVLHIRGYERATVYLPLMLYNIFLSQEVNIKHFETIVSSMCFGYMLHSTEDDPDHASAMTPITYGRGSVYPVGSLVSRQELVYSLPMNYDLCAMTLVGLKALPKYRSDFFESMFMENPGTYVPRAMLFNPNDSMSNPIIRAAFGLNIGIGTDLGE